MYTFKLIESFFEAVENHGHLMIILSVKNNIFKVKVWNHARWRHVSISGEFIEDFFSHEDTMKNNIIEHLFKEAEDINHE